MRGLSFMAAGVCLVLVSGCERELNSAGVQPRAAPARASQSDPTEPLPKLPAIDLYLGTQQITAEVARTFDQIRTGMMFRTSIGEDEGMLFVFSQPHRAAFYMKNVTVELSVAYIDPAGRVLEIHDLEPREERPVEAATDRVQFVLETSRGWFERRGITAGTLVRTERGTLQETFFGSRAVR